MSESERQCDFCPKTFKSKPAWKDHNLQEHNTQAFLCEFCPAFFYDDGEYILHYQTEHKTEFTARHTCDVCGVSYKYHRFLQSHVEKYHRVERLMKCAKCGAEFCNSVAYNIHVKLKHAGRRKFHKCKECQRRFTSKDVLRLHEKFDHNPNGKRYFKQYCRDNLDVDDELKQLLKHSKSVTQCGACDVRFSTAIDLFKHLKAVHSTKKYFQCCQCDDTKYVTRGGMGIHLTYEHGLSRQHRCSTCTTGHDKPPATKKVPKSDCIDESNTPPWSILYVTSELPQNVDLTDATATEIDNLRKNIRSMFHVLSTIPTSTLRGEPKNNSIVASIRSMNAAHRKPVRWGKMVTFSQDENVESDKTKVGKTSERRVLDMDRKHEKLYAFECGECKLRFISSNALNIHTGTSHGKPSRDSIDRKKRAKKSTKVDVNASTQSIDLTKIEKNASTQSIDLSDASDEVTIVIEVLDEAGPFDCTEMFETTESQITQEDTQYKCNLCNTQLADQVSLLNHMTEAHPRLGENLDTELFKCLVCGLGFRGEEQLNGHMKIHFDNSMQSDSNHDLSLNSTQSDTSRDTTETDPNLKQECSICQKTFNDLRGLYLHNLRAHGMKTVYPCVKCKTEFTDKRKLRKHKIHCKVQQTIKVKVEKENSNAVRKLKDHQIMKEMKRKLLLMCKKEMQQKQRPDEKRIHKCLKCESKFARRQLLLQHIRNKHNIPLNKLYKCSMCSSVFKMEDKLKQHIKMKHSDVKQRSIPVIRINKSKMSPVKLDKGKLPSSLSNILSKSLLNGAMHSCKECHSFFPSSELLQRHVQWEHTKHANLHKCGQCNEVLYTIEDLELHMSNAHNTFKWKKQIASIYEQQTDI